MVISATVAGVSVFNGNGWHVMDGSRSGWRKEQGASKKRRRKVKEKRKTDRLIRTPTRLSTTVNRMMSKC